MKPTMTFGHHTFKALRNFPDPGFITYILRYPNPTLVIALNPGKERDNEEVTFRDLMTKTFTERQLPKNATNLLLAQPTPIDSPKTYFERYYGELSEGLVLFTVPAVEKYRALLKRIGEKRENRWWKTWREEVLNIEASFPFDIDLDAGFKE